MTVRQILRAWVIIWTREEVSGALAHGRGSSGQILINTVDRENILRSAEVRQWRSAPYFL